MPFFAVIVAAGKGRRFGEGTPKQFCCIGGSFPIKKSVELFLSFDFVSGIVCAIPSGFQEVYTEIFKSVNDPRLLQPVVGGGRRSDSVRIALKVISQYSPNYVLIHDAVRCFCPRFVVENVFQALNSGAKAVIPEIFPTDSVRVNGKSVSRSSVKLSQTPQGFCFEVIYQLHQKYKDKDFTDDATLCELEDIDVTSVMGDVLNRKITFQSDVAKEVFKTGFGYDAHRFSETPEKKLYLMGREIENHKGLEGISDADVGIHSVVDAILGALGAGSIGEHFPASEPKNKNADSKIFLKYCRELLIKKEARLTSIDTTIVCESPNISAYATEMKRTIASYLEVPKSSINIKGKTTEGMGFEGRREGISATTIVTIKQNVLNKNEQ
ncbi:MAG: 2-C-methyl-D-erythritol 2,4-cyclodiphosphate synthase [Holosporales bacterium]|nr:2-C-methyl-D-erythritol 2,4-cyclodiphosphate synthase [Holosporales bacterium]